jgi:hypothetical protein
MKRITVDLEDQQFERLRKAAFDRHEPMSVIIRDALEKELRELGSKGVVSRERDRD